MSRLQLPALSYHAPSLVESLLILALSLCALFSLDAHGMAPTPDQGNPPVRNRVTTGQGQAAFLRSAPWKRFIESAGVWQAQFDERTGTPHRMWGPGIDLGPVPDASAVQAALIGWMQRHTELLGVDSTHPIALRSANHHAPSNTWYVDFDTLIKGVPVWGGGLTFRVRQGQLILVGADTYPTTPLLGDFSITARQAIDLAIASGPNTVHTDRSATPVWLPQLDEGVLVLRAVYEVHTRTQSPRGDWVVFVDAQTGEIASYYNDIRFLTGTILAENEIRFPGSGTEISAVSGGEVTGATRTVYTNTLGEFDISDDGPFQTSFVGSPFSVANTNGNSSLDIDDTGEVLWDADNGDIVEIDTFVHAQRVRATFNQVVPDVAWTDGRANATVNIADACNAFYDGSLNFFIAGSGCNNTGRLADVVYHEWGHGLHANSILSGTFDGGLSEGSSDVVAALMTGDPQIAPGFFTSGNGVLRNIDNDNTYPDDLVGQVHEDGKIFSGSMWNTWQNIAAVQGEEIALAESKKILTGLFRGGPTLDGSFAEAIIADDDDADLSNGTPNECEIVAGFSAHGLGPYAGGNGFYAGHEPIAAADPETDQPVAFNIVGPVSCADDMRDGTAVLSYRVDGGEWQEAPLDVSGFDVAGSVPSQPFGSFVEYYATITKEDRTLSAPTYGWRNPYSYYVGGVIPVHCDDFENGREDYTHQLVSGQAGDGADDWQIGAPRGLGGDPSMAHSGTKVWGNDLGRGNFNGLYQPDKHNMLEGPVVELGHYEDVFLHYWRWLQIEDATYDKATIRLGDDIIWKNVEGDGADNHRDDQWTPHAVDLGNPVGSVQVSWHLKSDGAISLGGWTIDDVCIFAPATPNNRLGVVDFLASEGQDGGVSLSWTNPPHAPLEELRVVRKLGGCPSDVDDGEVVFYDTAPELEAAMEVFDPVPSTETYCYGVFPGDGTDFLGFAVQDWNIDEGSADTAATKREIKDSREANGLVQFDADQGIEPKGCGCSGAGGLTGGLWALGVAALIRRRR